MIKQLAHVCIHSRDLRRTQEFYERLGLDIVFHYEKGGAVIGFYVALGNSTFIEVFEGKARKKNGTIDHICLEVDDIDEVAAELERHRIKTSEKRLGDDRSWQIWCSDPNGLKIEFHQYTAESRQLNGGTVQASW